MISERLEELGIVLPDVFAPVGNYLGCVIVDDVVYVGGHGPVNGQDIVRGKGRCRRLVGRRTTGGADDGLVDPGDAAVRTR